MHKPTIAPTSAPAPTQDAPTIDAATLAWEREVYAASPIGGDACRY